MARSQKTEIRYFRTRTGLEVDFVLNNGGSICAIEAKAGTISSDDLKSLKLFRKAVKGSIRCFAVGLKETRARKLDGVLICDWRTLINEIGL